MEKIPKAEPVDFGKSSKVDESNLVLPWVISDTTPSSPMELQKEKSAVEAGKLFNVSEKYVREAKKLKETSPEQFEEVRMGCE